jgi:hypothetical protein
VAVFIIEINGTAVIAFNAQNRFDAEREAASPHVRTDLMTYETEGGPIWNGRDEIVVREARPVGREYWALVCGISEPPEEGVVLQVYLIEIVNGAARHGPLN